jgi:hypothetical protein
MHRNRYSEGIDNGQITPHGYPNFNSYVKNLRFFIFQTDRQTDTEINPGGAGGNLIGSSRLTRHVRYRCATDLAQEFANKEIGPTSQFY